MEFNRNPKVQRACLVIFVIYGVIEWAATGTIPVKAFFIAIIWINWHMREARRQAALRHYPADILPLTGGSNHVPMRVIYGSFRKIITTGFVGQKQGRGV
jgi:hypothetical protein